MRSSTLITLSTLVLLAVSGGQAASRQHAVELPTASYFCDFGDDVAGVTVPAGFCIRKFADVPTPRVLLFAPNGDLFVSSPRMGTPGGAPAGTQSIYLLRQTDTSLPPVLHTYANGPSLVNVHGLLITGGNFLYTVADGVYSVPYTPGDTQMSTATPVLVAELPTTQLYRWTHSLAVATDGTIYVATGQFDNEACPSQNARLGAVLKIGNGHDSKGDLAMNGMRDPLYIRCMPWGTCYAAELSGDTWESFGGTEKLVEIHDGQTIGYPCCIDRNLPNPDISPAPDCSKVMATGESFHLHDTPFGFDWERGFGWPDPYKGAFFVGLHGAFGSWIHAGLQWAPTDPTTHLPTQATIDFATGFGHGAAINRVGDVAFSPDGRLFFADDQGGRIYFIAPRTLLRPKVTTKAAKAKPAIVH